MRHIDETTRTNTVLLFLHTPKTGGSTLDTLLYNQLCDAEYYADAEDKLFHAGVRWFPGSGFFKPQDLAVDEATIRALGRPDLRAVLGHFWFGIHEFLALPYQYVTLLRQPVDRVVSLYHHIGYGDELSLEEFARTAPYREVDNDQTRRISGLEPPLGQCESKMLETAKENLKRDFAVVGLTERFDETLVLLKMTFDWPTTPLYVPRLVNVAKRRKQEITDSCRQIVENRNLLDQQLYDFAESLLEERIKQLGSRFADELAAFRERNQRHIEEHRDSIKEMGLGAE